MTGKFSSDERTTPPKIERREGRVAAENESCGGEISVEKYSNPK
jgi:hypothetical protein